MAERSRLLKDFGLVLPTIRQNNEVNIKKRNTDKVSTELMYQATTANTANVVFNALTLEWPKYSYYVKLWRILAYILRLLPKLSNNRTETASITDPFELEVAEQKLIFLV